MVEMGFATFGRTTHLLAGVGPPATSSDELSSSFLPLADETFDRALPEDAWVEGCNTRNGRAQT
jgi:hypothetical protein